MGLRDLFRKHKKEHDILPSPTMNAKTTKQHSSQQVKHDKDGLGHVTKDATV